MEIRLTLVLISIFLSLTIVAELTSAAAGCTREDFENVLGSARETIYILADGRVDPSNTPIQRVGDKYIFTADIYASLIVDKENIVIDGAGYMLHGPYNGTQTDLWIIGEGEEPNQTTENGTQVPWTVGIDIRPNIHGLTIQNLNIKNFTIGIWLWTTNNAIFQNAIQENSAGILLSGVNNSITGNYIAKNRDGIFFGANQPGDIPANITLSLNGFVDNKRHLSGCVCADFNNTEATHTWDDGQKGNYWSNYAGIDANRDGLGDTPYVIDVLNQDRYPMIQNSAVVPSVAPKLPLEIIVIVALLMVIATVAVVKRTKKR